MQSSAPVFPPSPFGGGVSPYGNPTGMPAPHQLPHAVHMQQGGFDPTGGVGAGGCVIHFAGFPPPPATTPDELFLLVGVYANVVRVKILYQKQNTALIQLAEAAQGRTALQYMNGMMFRGQQLRVTISPHTSIAMPRSDAGPNPLTKDFSDSKLWRFRSPTSKNYKHITAPCDTVHLSNLPPEIADAELHQLFASVAQVDVQQIHFFPNDRKMALVRLAT